MATEQIIFYATTSRTFYAQVVRQSDGYVLDQDDNTWKASAGDCTNPKISLVEQTSSGGTYRVPYKGSQNMAYVNGSSTAAAYTIEVLEDLASDILRGQLEIWVGNARIFPDAERLTQLSILNTVGSTYGKVTTIQASTDNLPVDPASETNVDANETKLDTLIAAVAALTDLDKATVKEIWFTDTTSELAQGAPPNDAALAVQLRWLYQYFRNLRRQNRNTELIEMLNDAQDTVIAKAPVSDDGTTASKGEYVSGP